MYNITNPEDLGRVIALWSPVHRQGAVSATTALLASYIAEQMDAEDNEKILIMSNEIYGSPTASFYMTNEDMIDGMQEVIQLSLSDNLKKPEEIYTNTFSLSPRIDILNCGKRNRDLGDLLEQEIGNILDMARVGYKYIIIDTVCGPHDKSSKKIIENCDLVMACIPQDRYIFDSWIRKTPGIYVEELKNGKPLITLSAMHCEYPDMKYESMRKEIKGRKLYYVSLNDIVHEAVSKRNIPEMIKANIKLKSPDSVIGELDALIDAIDETIAKIVVKEQQEKSFDIEKNKKETSDYLKGLSIKDLNEELYANETTAEDLEVTDEDLYGPTDETLVETSDSVEDEYTEEVQVASDEYTEESNINLTK